MSVKGLQTPVEQVGSTYLVKSDGLIEATLTFIELTGVESGSFGGGQASSITSGSESGAVSAQRNTSSNKGIPGIGGEHPNVPNLFCTHRTVTYGEAGQIITTCSFLGIEGEETERFLSYVAGVNSENIDAHPRFDVIGGTPSEPKNGATFDDNGLFAGFEAGSELAGEANYYAPGATVEVSYYTFTKPSLVNRMTIYDEPAMGDNYFQKPEPQDTLNYLLIDTPYREVVPGSGLYQVTEQYLQSEEYGWNTRIYDKNTG